MLGLARAHQRAVARAVACALAWWNALHFFFMISLSTFSFFVCRSGSSVEKWRVEFTSSADCHPVKLACQLMAASHILDVSSAGMWIRLSPSLSLLKDNEIKRISLHNPLVDGYLNKIFSFLFFTEEETVGDRLYNIERYLAINHQLL